MDHQGQEQLEQPLHVEQVELLQKLIMEQVELELLIEVVEVEELEAHITHHTVIVVEQVALEL